MNWVYKLNLKWKRNSKKANKSGKDKTENNRLLLLVILHQKKLRPMWQTILKVMYCEICFDRNRMNKSPIII
jgi:hypothetical protein